MIEYLNKLEEERTLLLKQTDKLSEAQYNWIPEGFNNNIIWNMGHLIVVSENLLYKDTPFPRPIHEFDLASFKRGKKPEAMIIQDEIGLIRDALQAATSFYRKSAGVNNADADSPQIRGVDIDFLLFHERMHYRAINRLMQHL